ncbi:MAG: type II/IV secretion system protein [Candidatus Nealsonbacteria bacterium]|nr:type II/IV secretion system protein [Candidatus Nealsonbacteria bacterium]
MVNSTTPKKVSGEIQVSRLGYPEKIKSIPTFARTIAQIAKQNVSELLEAIFIGAIDLGASDVHIETEEKQVKIRLRIDGVLQDLVEISHEDYRPLLSRLKLISGTKLNISDRPQDGRFSIVDNQKGIEVRSSTLPAEYGESIVLRVLNSEDLISLEQLGLRPDLLATFRKEIAKPNGMIIVTGPTGSGKTTTLYAFLKEVQSSEIKIITIEDPIEYRLSGISQTQVDPAKGYDFASGLRAIVRQDPDVILVGEIRDLETAEIALQAALTGHLVFSTLHANDAAGTVARLTDLGANTPSVAAAINSTIAQRLIRKVCPKCVELKTITPDLLDKISRALANLPPSIEIPPLTKETRIPTAKGCENCSLTGYRGRIGIFEAFLIDEEMERFILKNPATSDLRERATGKGMVSMYQDGLIRILEGITTIEELERIVGQE